ncbi:purine and uridine phosphorylase [Tuber magnatum]|uniref:Purine and uridine phosphorylase n=1 Tax=Tuber magnatum TaxID=42249 RepID=A0A317SEN9_9PEZI|nr:purine and uridine phosphorylase [Tuber magnatum]
MRLPNTFSSFKESVRTAVIGRTRISALEAEGFTAVASLSVQTLYCAPRSPLTILKTPQNTPIAFISHHGLHHELTPTEVPNRAKIAALLSIVVRSIIAFSAVGSSREHISPRDFVTLSQIIDRTKGIRASTFFEGGLVGHVGFADPFDTGLAKAVFDIGSDGVLNGEGGSWGGDVINMSTLPEAKLAKEAGVVYVMLCNMHANSANVKHLAAAILKESAKEEHQDLINAKHVEGSSKWARYRAASEKRRGSKEDGVHPAGVL